MRPPSSLKCLPALVLLACSGTITEGSGGGGSDGGGGDDDDIGPGAPDAAVVPDEPDAAPPELPLAAGVTVRHVDVFQGVELRIVADGQPVGDADRATHVVAGKDALVGVLVDTAADFTAREITGQLEIEVAPGDVRLYTTVQMLPAGSGKHPAESGFAFQVAGDDLVAGARYSVTLVETSLDASFPGATDGARFPAGAEATRQDMEVRSINGPLNLVLVPFQYNADGSGRLPPLDDATLDKYRALFGAMYPIGEINLTVREPVPYSGSLTGGGGWSSWLDTLTNIRDNDNPPPNTWYFGVAAPRSSFSAYCNGGCIVGLGWVPGRDDEYGRASVGVSFPDALGLFTAAHEVGHTMGRSHAPCGGPSGVDPSYPYSGASIGVWGYDVFEDDLKQPSEYTDVMGYCNRQWISDYTYDGILHRIEHVNSTAAAAAPESSSRYRVGIVDELGAITWRRYDDIQSRVGGEQRAVQLLDADGTDIGAVTARFYGYDHIPGGMILVPVDNGPSPASIRIDRVGTVAW